MIEILKKGIKKDYRITICNDCDSELKFKKEDVQIGSFRYIVCPICGGFINVENNRP